MRKAKPISPYIDNGFHINYLLFFPIVALVAGSFFSASLQSARNDLRIIGMNLRSSGNTVGRTAVIFYKVEEEETLETLAEKFDVSQESIIWANEVPPEEITPNSVIRIPPVTGVIHVVQYLDTLENIAERYGVTPEAITNYKYNEFSNDPAFPLYGGQILIIPGGRK